MIQTLTGEEKRDSVLGVIGKYRTLEPFLPTFWQDFQNILGFSIQFRLCSRPKNNAKNWGRFWSHAFSTSSPADWFCPVVSTDQYVFQIWLVLCPWFLSNISPCLLFLVIKFHALMVVMSGCWLYTLFTAKGSKFAKKNCIVVVRSRKQQQNPPRSRSTETDSLRSCAPQWRLDEPRTRPTTPQ